MADQEMREAIDRLNDAASALRGASGRMGQGVVDMEHYIDVRVDEIHKSVDSRFAAVQRDVEKTARDVFDKFLHSNAVREEMRQLEGTFPSRPEMDGQIFPLKQEMAILRLNVNSLEKTVIDRAALENELKPINETVREFRSFRDTYAGKATQSSVFLSYAISILALVVATFNIVLHWAKP